MATYLKRMSIGETAPQTLIASVAQTMTASHGYSVYYAPKSGNTVKDTDFQPFKVDGVSVVISANNPLFVTTLPGTYAFALAQQQNVELNVAVVDYIVTARGTL